MKNKHDILTYCVYFPQFHSLIENDKNFYPGYTDMTNLDYLQKNYPEILINTPSLKELDLKNILDYNLLKNSKIIQKQVDIIERYNISGFAIYYYWFSNNNISNKNMLMKEVTDNFFSNNIDIKNRKVFFIWANQDWSKHPNIGEKNGLIENNYTNIDIIKNVDNLITYFKHSNYLKINNKPVFLLHHPWYLSENELLLFKNILTEKCLENNFDGVHLIVNSTMNIYDNYLNYDFHYTFKYNKSCCKIIKNKENNNLIFDYNIYTKNCVERINNNKNIIKTFVFDYDDKIRCAFPNNLDKSISCINNSLENQVWYLENIIESYSKNYGKTCTSSIEKIMLINSWNEWGQQMAIEPSNEKDFHYLELLKKYLT